MLLTFFVWHLCLGRPLLAIENIVRWQPFNGSRQNSLALWDRRLILELSFVCSFAQCNKLMNTLGGKWRAMLSYTNDKCLFLLIRNVFYYFPVQTFQFWDPAVPAIISDFISLLLPWNLTCVSRNDGRHQSVSGNNFKRWGCRKINRAEIAQEEIPTRRPVVNPESYEENWFLLPSTSHFGLCIRRGAV